MAPFVSSPVSGGRLVTISGLPGSGKSDLASALGDMLDAPVVVMDTCYLPAPLGGGVDFSDPANLDVDAVVRQIHHHWETGSKSVIVEGIFALAFEELRTLASVSVWLDIPLDIGLARKLLRKLDAGADVAPSIRGYLERGRAGYLRHVLPGRESATVCVDATQPVDDLVKEVADAIAERAGDGRS